MQLNCGVLLFGVKVFGCFWCKRVSMFSGGKASGVKTFLAQKASGAKGFLVQKAKGAQIYEHTAPPPWNANAAQYHRTSRIHMFLISVDFLSVSIRSPKLSP